MEVLPAKTKRREKNCTGRYSTGLTNQSGEYVVNLCKSNIPE